MSARSLAAAMLRPVDLDAPSQTSLTRGSVLSTTGLLAQGVLRFATAFLVGHIAGREQLGLVASAIATATLLALLWPTTTGSAASKFIARARGAGNDSDVHSVAAHLSRRTVQTGIVLGVASAGVWVLVDHGSWVEAATVAVLTLAYSGYSFTRGVQFGARQVPRATSWDVASVMFGLSALVVLLAVGVRGPTLILPLVLAYALYTVAGWPHGARGRPAAPLRRELDGFVALGAAGSLASTGFLQLSQITAKVSTGDAGAGQYAAALNLATPASMLAASLSLVLFPSMAQAWGRGDTAGFHVQTDRATRALAVVMVAIFGSIILCSRLAVHVIWGSRFEGAQQVLPVLVLAVLATNLAVPSVNALTTRSQRGMWVTTGASLLGLAAGGAVWWALAGRMGTVGVAVGYLCGTIVIASIPVAVTWWSARHAWSGVFVRVAAALLLVGALVWLQHAAHLSPWTDPLAALVFLAAWLFLARADVRLLPLDRVRRRA